MYDGHVWGSMDPLCNCVLPACSPFMMLQDSTKVTGCTCTSQKGASTCEAKGSGKDSCKPIYKRITTTILNSTFSDKLVNVTVAGVTKSQQAQTGPNVVSVDNLGVNVVGPDVKEVPPLVITVSEVETTAKQEEVDW